MVLSKPTMPPIPTVPNVQTMPQPNVEVPGIGDHMHLVNHFQSPILGRYNYKKNKIFSAPTSNVKLPLTLYIVGSDEKSEKPRIPTVYDTFLADESDDLSKVAC